MQQPVVFTTKTPYPLPTQKFMIPTTWRRYHLSQLVNKALSLSTSIPFDFLVRGEILKSSLGEWCSRNGVGEEETLEIEYIQSVMPPQKMSDFPHEDWVSAVLPGLQGYLLTASYDGSVRAFDYSKNMAASAEVHQAPATCLSLIPSTTNEDSTYIIASSSHDLTAAISRLNLRVDGNTSETRVLTTLHLHTAPVSSVSSNLSGTHLLTSSWDGLIGLWTTDIPSMDEVPEPEGVGRERKKRRKVADDSKPYRKAPVSVLKSHTNRVSKVVFGQGPSTPAAYSCGFDSTVRVWDTEMGISTHTITAAEKPFLDLAVSFDGRHGLAASTDRTMMLYDLRSTESAVTTSSSSSFLHPATPSCVSLSENGNQVATGAYDGIVRIWDLRSNKGAMASFKAWDGGQKILDVDWKHGIIGVAGEGGAQVWKVGESTN
ncbi:Ribosome biogenesis protein YTM1 [Leucoagaricus sp. SymC.cos]|nr:Ribosome biogenesis protein YTM1 [Leucoagaricus sp. SymC.cos]